MSSIQPISSSDSPSVWFDSIAQTGIADGTATTSTAASLASAPSTASVSPMGQFFSKLSSLASSDPDKFKSLTADIATQLTDAAATATGPQADLLKTLAQKFADASQSGSATGLQPTQGHHHHHHHDHRAQAAYGTQQAGSTVDPTAVQPTTGTTGSAGTATDLRTVFENIFQEVAQA